MDTKDLSKVQKDRNIKLEKLRSDGFDYPNDFEKKYDISYLVEKFGNFSKSELEKKNQMASNAGRVVLKREMGKVVFITIEDFSGRIQAYFSKNNSLEYFLNISSFHIASIIIFSFTFCISIS